MAFFRIDLRLKPSAPGERELAGWPETQFSPDFIVAASGLARIELESKVIGVTAEGSQPIATATDHLSSKQINYWLPDYTAGFALNLVQAAVQLKRQERHQASAAFIDEPLELRFERVGGGEVEELKLSFHYSGETITGAEGPAVLVYAEIARAVQDFMVQLLTLNPGLAGQPDLTRLRGLLAELVK